MKDGKYTTKHGSIAIVKGGRLKSGSFEWFEEPDACDACENLEIEDDALVWSCEYCEGGSSKLTLVEEK